MTALAEGRRPRRWRRALTGNLGWLLASNGLMVALSLVYVGIVTRTLGIADFGRFALITGAAQTLAIVMSAESWKIVVQYGLAHEARGDQAAIAGLVEAALRVEWASAALGIASVLLLFALSGAPFGLAAELRPYALGYAVAQFLSARSTPTGLLRLKDRFGMAAMADSVQPVARLAGTLLAFACWPTIQGFLVAYAAAEMLGAAAVWILALRSFGPLWREAFDWRRTLGENRGLLRALLSTNLQSSLGLASRQVPLLLIGRVDGPAAAGAFRLALQLANALVKLSTLIMRAAFPEIVRWTNGLSGDRFHRLVWRLLATGASCAALLMLLASFAAQPLLMLVGGIAFAGNYPVLLWLAAAGCVDLAGALLEPVLLGIHRPGTLIMARCTAVLVQLGAMAVLLPSLGALGAGISLFVGAIAGLLLLGFHLARHAGARC